MPNVSYFGAKVSLPVQRNRFLRAKLINRSLLADFLGEVL